MTLGQLIGAMLTLGVALHVRLAVKLLRPENIEFHSIKARLSEFVL